MLTLYTTPVIYIFFDNLAQTLLPEAHTKPAPATSRRTLITRRPRWPADECREIKMNISAPFIHRPVATTLLTIAIAIAGVVGYTVLPVSPLPQVDFPTIQVQSSLPGASAEITASSIATPLERQFAHIAGITEMTSSSSLGSTNITLQFDLSRNIDGAARDGAGGHQRRAHLPAGQPARQPDLSQGQPGRRADHDPRPHLG